MKLPSHTTSKLQPLDISVFGPMKTYWADRMNNWIASMGIPVKAMTKKQFVNNVSQIWFKGMSSKNVKAGFEAVGIYPFNPERYNLSCFDPILVEKYNRWIEMGRPDEMLSHDQDKDQEEAAPDNIDPNRNEDRWNLPPPLDNNGNPVKGRWVWIGEDDDDRLSDRPASSTTSGQKSTTFLDIVAKRLNQTTPTSVNKRVKRVNMNAAVITQEEIDDQLQARVTDETPKKPKRRTTTVSSSDEESDNDGSVLNSDELSESDQDQPSDLDKDEEVLKTDTIRKILNEPNCDVEYKGKLFAVHFDKPKKFYIGCLHLTFCEEAGSDVTEVAFKFLDFKGDGRYYMKPNIVVETVLARNVSLGHIEYEPIKNDGYLLKNITFEEISRAWATFSANL